MGHSPEVGPAQFFILNFLHEKGRILSNIPPETIQPIRVFKITAIFKILFFIKFQRFPCRSFTFWTYDHIHTFLETFCQCLSGTIKLWAPGVLGKELWSLSFLCLPFPIFFQWIMASPNQCTHNPLKKYQKWHEQKSQRS